MSALASSILHVVKRSGKRQKYTNNKIVRHLNELARKRPVLAEISANEISNRATLSNDMTTIALADHIAEVCASLTVRHWQYGALGGRVVISSLHHDILLLLYSAL